MISIEEAVSRVLDRVQVLSAERREIVDALGQVLGRDVLATFDIPPHDNAAMDGYAVRAADTLGARADDPCILEIVGQLHAGQVPTVGPRSGQAVRIMTGAPMPPGADAVVQFEMTNECQHGLPIGGNVAILAEARSGDNVRRAGEDVGAGDVVLRANSELRPAEIGVLASLGMTAVEVIRRPRVAILSTGDELLSPGEEPRAGKIYDANSYSLAALVRRYGGIPMVLGIARDSIADLTAKLGSGLGADLLITSAGVSVGDYDVVKDVLAAEGEVTFWQVRIKPGKPLAFGQVHGVPHLGLPGNPVASMVAFEQFGRPAVLKMLGKRLLRKPEVEATLVGQARNRDGRRCFLRATVEKRQGQFYATLAEAQGSGILTSMARANGLVIIPEDVGSIRSGDRVRVQMLDWPEQE